MLWLSRAFRFKLIHLLASVIWRNAIKRRETRKLNMTDPDTNILAVDHLLTSDDVLKITSLKSRVTLWRRSRNPEDPFPRPYKFGPQSTRWKLSETAHKHGMSISQWIKSVMADKLRLEKDSRTQTDLELESILIIRKLAENKTPEKDVASTKSYVKDYISQLKSHASGRH